MRGPAPVRRRGARGRRGVDRRAAARPGHPGRPGRAGAPGPAVERRALGAAGPPSDGGAGRREVLGRAHRHRPRRVLHGHQVGLAGRARAGGRPGHEGRAPPPRLPHRAAHRAGHDRPRRRLRHRLVGVRDGVVRRGDPGARGARPRPAAPRGPARRGGRHGARQPRPAVLQGHPGRARHRRQRRRRAGPRAASGRAGDEPRHVGHGVRRVAAPARRPDRHGGGLRRRPR